MGGHAAWRKRVANRGLAKGSGGAALRHRPRLGRRGKGDLALNRKGNLGGHGNPKKMKNRKRKKNNSNSSATVTNEKGNSSSYGTVMASWMNALALVGALCFVVAGVFLAATARVRAGTPNNKSNHRPI